jgi:hypothetical protein
VRFWLTGVPHIKARLKSCGSYLFSIAFLVAKASPHKSSSNSLSSTEIDNPLFDSPIQVQRVSKVILTLYDTSKDYDFMEYMKKVGQYIEAAGYWFDRFMGPVPF